MAYTISTHNGSQVSRQHNLRNRNITDKEEHIDPFGDFEIWHDEAPARAYDRIFGQAIADYNSKQYDKDQTGKSAHPERRMYNYYQHVCKSAKQHAVYEMIVGVGRLGREPDPAVGKQILKEFADGWRSANPNLEMIGCYYHADEVGVPHIHIDYVPVAHGYKKGLHTQNGLVKALGEMGYQKKGRDTAQIQWQRAENSRLETICRSHGLEIVHPEVKHQEHLETSLYKLEIKARDLEERVDQLNLSVKQYERLKGKYERLRAFGEEVILESGKTVTETFDKQERRTIRELQEMTIEF